ncbi:hypothetical protein GCM10010503_03640 [Streptomyces lucensis JCM 4490]|uniref:Gram-positive cocci surface proteins LPxTG domain-containing protein n=1 Tax=Streptomyces lucensis JCM 4490 TaxID=1306176 RepID=A0A918ITB2_9ACTN|nr:LAETG motif-containing sortase-dependent surface protein [Streptomyces lucensis]GGW31231.1 hypothetical protein GCM10010503_03640 [Streptomyces lucensis JCM 4490]
MSSARRPLLTATAAGTLLCALWFVPSAHASQDSSASGTTAGSVTSYSPGPVTQQARAVSAVSAEGAQEAADGTELADTGSPDTTPYIVGGTLFLAVGAGFVVYSVRRERLGF